MAWSVILQMATTVAGRSESKAIKELRAEKMSLSAAALHRSVSLPTGPNPNSGPTAAGKAYHARSASLPCRSHPTVSQIEDAIRSVRGWLSSGHDGGRAGAGDGLVRLELLHVAVGDLLHLPHELLNRGGSAALADDFLAFGDAYGSFRSALFCLQELQSAAQMAIRRRDEARLISAAKSLRKVTKELASLVSSLRGVASGSAESAFAAAAAGRSASAVAELSGILGEATALTVSASAAVFQETAGEVASTADLLAPRTSSWTTVRRRLPWTSSPKKKTTEDGEDWSKLASEKMDRMAEVVAALETGSERLFRSLLNSRVTLLNMLTP